MDEEKQELEAVAATDSDLTVTIVDQEPGAVDTKEPEKPKGHTRAGITTNKGHGTPKSRRRIAAKSRRINRRK